MKTLGDHPGFQAIQQHIAHASGMPMDQAGAVLADAGRNASPSAKRKNPNLNKIKGKKSKGKSSSSSPSNGYMFGK